MRKFTSISTLGMVDLKSDKERIASNTKKTTKELKKQTELMKKDELKRQALANLEQQRRLRGESVASAPPVNHTTSVEQATARLEQLKTLGELRDSGVLTPEEFEAEKAKVLSKDSPTSVDELESNEGTVLAASEKRKFKFSPPDRYQ